MPDEVEDRTEDAHIDDVLEAGLVIGGVHFRELFPSALLLVERLDHLDAGEFLRQNAVDLCQDPSEFAVHFSHHDAEDDRDDDAERQNRKRDQRQLPVDVQNDDKGADEHAGRSKHLDSDGREHGVDGLDVVRHPGHELANGRLIVKRDGKTLQMLEERHS